MEERGRDFYLVQLNIRSIYSRLVEFKFFLFTKRPHIVCLQETRAKTEQLLHFVNYQTLWKQRPNGVGGGGIAILIRSDLVIYPTNLVMYPNTVLEAQRCKVKF